MRLNRSTYFAIVAALVGGNAHASDCNGNGIMDAEDIASGRAFDTNQNGIPDGCDADIALPVLRALVVNRGPYCGWWTTGTLAGVWDLWISREPTGSSWINGASAPGNTIDLWAELKPGVNTLYGWHDSNGCGQPGFALGLWFSSNASPEIAVQPGDPCAPYAGELNTPYASGSTTGSGSNSTQIGKWLIRVVSYEVSGSGDLVGPESIGGSGSTDLRATIVIEVLSNDPDNDGVAGSLDNCPTTPNPDQLDCNANGIGEACESFTDCNRTLLPDSCDIAAGTSADADANGVPDECQPDCNLNELPDAFEIATGLVSDLNSDGTPDDCQGARMVRLQSSNLGAPSGSAARVWNVPGLPVAETGVTLTVDLRGDLNGQTEWVDVVLNDGAPRRFFETDGSICPETPDRATISLTRDEFNAIVGDAGLLSVRVECPPTVDGTECKGEGLTVVSLGYVGIDPKTGDCNGNGRLDVAEVFDGTTPDCNANKVPDSCDIARGGAADCNANGVPDACEIAATPSIDCDGNGTIDACDIAAGGTSVDCDQNGRIDSCQVAEAPGTDCNANLRPDACDVASGTSADRDGNLEPDECQTVSVPGDYGTIQAAIDAAPSDEMRIVSVAAGTYSGPIAFNGKPVVVRGAGAGQTVISGSSGQSLSVVRFTGGEPAIAALERVTVRGGATGSPIPGSPQFLVGGGLFGYNSAANVRDCVVEQNVSSFGGGAYLLNCTGTLERCVFRNNNAGTDGGGIQTFRGTPTIADCIVENNVCNSRGAGMHLNLGNQRVLRTIVRGNTSTNVVGGVSWVPGSAPGTSLTIEDCDVTGNTALLVQGGIGVLDSSTAVTMSLRGTEVCGNLPRPNVVGRYDDLGGNAVCDCAGDLTLDGTVNGADLGILLAAWGPCTGACASDLNDDGVINGADLGALLAQWGSCGP